MGVYDNPSAVAHRPGEELLAASQVPGTWSGFIGRIVLYLLQVISSILYWAVRLTTITVPTLLFSIFSTSWTVTMNATTL